VRLDEALRAARATRSHNAYISLQRSEHSSGGDVIAVKDNIDVAGLVTTGGGRHLPGVPAERDATVIARLRDAGCDFVGKANLHEYAYGVTNHNSHYGDVVNPWDPSRVAGGSSGGSAVAVALGTCDWSLGSDTGGSTRIPASFCGLTTVKPTEGTVDNTGVIPLARSFDAVVPIARDVASTVRALEMITGDGALNPGRPPAGFVPRLAVPAGWLTDLDDQTRKVWEEVSAGLPSVDLPDLQELHDAFEDIFRPEVGAFHLRWMAESPELYGPDVRGRIQAAIESSGARMLDALARRPQHIADMEAAMLDYDALLLPSTAVVAPPLDRPDIREPLLRFTIPFTYTGQPVYAIPAPSSGLPVGVQVVGRRGADALVAQIAAWLEASWKGLSAHG
jgi:Asp-tRNA(Asn)/Glu-tRNA(Gln) amidotransferase A subunit family amidase